MQQLNKNEMRILKACKDTPKSSEDFDENIIKYLKNDCKYIRTEIVDIGETTDGDCITENCIIATPAGIHALNAYKRIRLSKTMRIVGAVLSHIVAFISGLIIENSTDIISLLKSL